MKCLPITEVRPNKVLQLMRNSVLQSVRGTDWQRIWVARRESESLRLAAERRSVRLVNSPAADPKRDGLIARLVGSSMVGHDLGTFPWVGLTWGTPNRLATFRRQSNRHTRSETERVGVADR